MSFSSRLALAAATVTAAAGAIAAGPPESGFDRPGGIYTNITTKDAAACAIACAQDRICMSWTFRITEYVGCSLKAVVPAAVADRNAISGVDDRAGDFLSLVSIAPPTPPPAPANVESTAPSALAAAEAPPSAAPEENTPELLGAPAGLSSKIGAIAPAHLHAAAIIRGLAPEIWPLLDITAPEQLPRAAAVTRPVLHASALQRSAILASAALVLPPEPEPLGAPTVLTARFAPLTRVAYRAPTTLARAAPKPTPLAIEDPREPLATPMTLAARFTILTRAAYRLPTTPARPAPVLTPLIPEEAPFEPLGAPSTLTVRYAPFSPTAYRAPTTLARPAPAFKPVIIEEPAAAPPAKSLALNDRVIVGLPAASAEQPSAGVVPVAYVAPDAAAASTAGAPEDELLGAP